MAALQRAGAPTTGGTSATGSRRLVTKITNSVFWMPLAIIYKLYSDVEAWPMELSVQLLLNGELRSNDARLKVSRCGAVLC